MSKYFCMTGAFVIHCYSVTLSLFRLNEYSRHIKNDTFAKYSVNVDKQKPQKSYTTRLEV